MQVVNSLLEYILYELRKNGLNAQANLNGNVLEIKITKDELRNLVLSRVPPEFKHLIDVDSGDITIRVRLL